MFYYSTKAKRIALHLKNCHHVKAIKSENLATISSVVEAEKQGIGIVVCKCCSTLGKDYSKNQKEILDFSYKNGIRCYMSRGAMCIITIREKWLIIPLSNGKGYELHHKNEYKKERIDSVSGYHNQHYGSTSIMEVLKYVSEHDWYRNINPLTIKHEKAPPRKGTRRWMSQQRNIKKKERKAQIRNVLNLIDGLSMQ